MTYASIVNTNQIMFDTDLYPNSDYHTEAGDYTCDIAITNPLLASWSDTATLNFRWEPCNVELSYDNWIITSTDSNPTTITQYTYSVNR